MITQFEPYYIDKLIYEDYISDMQNKKHPKVTFGYADYRASIQVACNIMSSGYSSITCKLVPKYGIDPIILENELNKYISNLNQSQ